MRSGWCCLLVEMRELMGRAFSYFLSFAELRQDLDWRPALMTATLSAFAAPSSHLIRSTGLHCLTPGSFHTCLQQLPRRRLAHSSLPAALGLARFKHHSCSTCNRLIKNPTDCPGLPPAPALDGGHLSLLTVLIACTSH